MFIKGVGVLKFDENSIEFGSFKICTNFVA